MALHQRRWPWASTPAAVGKVADWACRWERLILPNSWRRGRQNSGATVAGTTKAFPSNFSELPALLQLHPVVWSATARDDVHIPQVVPRIQGAGVAVGEQVLAKTLSAYSVLTALQHDPPSVVIEVTGGAIPHLEADRAAHLSVFRRHLVFFELHVLHRRFGM